MKKFKLYGTIVSPNHGGLQTIGSVKEFENIEACVEYLKKNNDWIVETFSSRTIALKVTSVEEL